MSEESAGSDQSKGPGESAGKGAPGGAPRGEFGRRRRRMARMLMLFVAPALLIAGALAFWLHGARYVGTENAYVKTDIAKFAAEVSGRAIAVNVHAHMQVTKGDVLVRIDPEPFVIALERAKAELDAARQEVRMLKASLAEARTELEDAKDVAAYFRKRFVRQMELAERGIMSASRHDELENDARTAGDKVTMAERKIARILASLGGRPDRPVDQHPLVRAKSAAVEQAKLDLDRTWVKAPASGTVVSVPLVAGEQITAAAPLFAIVTDRAPWVDANYKETDLTHVRPGQSATIQVDTYPGVVFEATVKSISPATGAEFAILPPQNASGNWVKVVQRLPVRLEIEPKPGHPPLRAGMTASVSIDTKRERTLADLFGGFTTATAKDLKAD